MESGRLSPVICESIKGDRRTEVEVDDIPIVQKLKRRRSSFFAEARENLSSNGLNNTNLDEETTTLRYMENMRKEDKEWTEIIKKRKHQYDEVQRCYEEHCKKRRVMTEKECLSYLDEKDRHYLENLPDFAAIERKYHQLNKSYQILQQLRKMNRVNSMKLLQREENNIEVQKQKIRSYSKLMHL